MELARNIDRIIEFELFDENSETKANIEQIDIIEFSFGKTCKNKQVHKYYRADGNGEVTYDETRQIFLVPLTQQDTITWIEPRIQVQLRIKFKDGRVEPTDIQLLDVAPVLSNEVI